MEKFNKVKNIVKFSAIFLFTFVSVILYMVYKPNINPESYKRDAERMIEENKKHIQNATNAFK